MPISDLQCALCESFRVFPHFGSTDFRGELADSLVICVQAAAEAAQRKVRFPVNTAVFKSSVDPLMIGGGEKLPTINHCTTERVQVISLGIAEYRSPTPMITAAFVVDDLGADVPLLSREGVRRRLSRSR